jgi:predicted DCC family thiol-disulfide oxidoreductase YuxK
MAEDSEPGGTVTVHYDGDCPFCSDYVRRLRLKESIGAPRLVDLRADPRARKALEAEGLDPDRGMVAEISGTRYEGADALHSLALLTTRSGAFNRVTAILFASPGVSRFSYPLLRAGRNATLALLGRQPFREDDPGWQAHFTVFSLTFALFAFVHFFIYAFRYTAFAIYPSTWLILGFGIWLLAAPGSKRAFSLLVASMAIDAWLHAPVQSNHTMLRNFFLMAVISAGSWHLLKGSRWSEFFRDVVPVGRVLLFVMYFYGVFHKINTGFLDPEVSCAVALWRELPWPIHLLDHPVIHHVTIYGTFVVETVIVIMLLAPSLRGLGILFGIGFHGFLALSGFAMYPAFTTLAIALHVLFLSPDQARAIVAGANFRSLVARFRSATGMVLIILCGLLIAFFAALGNYVMAAVAWLALAIPIALAILLPGKALPEAVERRPTIAGPLLWSRLGWLNVIGVLFFLNCAMPYFGLKTAQAMNMFANLRLEGGVNNHLVMRFAPAPFGYLDDLVPLYTPDGEPVVHARSGSPIALVRYHLLDWLDRHPGRTVSFMQDGVLHAEVSSADLRDEIADTLHPAWFRKWFHFQRVPTDLPPPCF